MYNKFISEEQNKVLEILEWLNLRLTEANNQLRGAKANNLDDKTVQYFNDKIDFYNECRENLAQDYYVNFNKDMLIAEKNVSKMKGVLWNEFKIKYPECTRNFEEVFRDGICAYKPFIKDYMNNIKVPDPTFLNLNDAFTTYSLVSMQKQKLDGFNKLFNGIYGEVGEYGTKPFVNRDLDETLISAPIWAINEINETVAKFYPKLKKEVVKRTIEVQKMYTKVSKDSSNKDLVREYNKANDELENYLNLVSKYENVAKGVQSPVARIKNATSKGAFSGMLNHGYEVFNELMLGVPKDIRKLSIKRDKTICHKQEIDDIVDSGKYCLETAEASMALNACLGKATEFELFNYEYSKSLIKQMAKNDIERNAEISRLKIELAALVDRDASVREAKKDAVSRMTDIGNGYKTARFNTPFGLVAYSNNKLVNVYTKETYPIAKVDEYVYDGKSLIYNVDENNAVLGIKSYSDVENKLALQAKNAKQNNLGNERIS